ncbi:MAG: hypothetical protein MZV63_23680 [Marinilabiliales bacterium]|nr:hypothetical protein [Marinilabiliales bacterium]
MPAHTRDEERAVTSAASSPTHSTRRVRRPANDPLERLPRLPPSAIGR